MRLKCQEKVKKMRMSFWEMYIWENVKVMRMWIWKNANNENANVRSWECKIKEV